LYDRFLRLWGLPFGWIDRHLPLLLNKVRVNIYKNGLYPKHSSTASSRKKARNLFSWLVKNKMPPQIVKAFFVDGGED
jgi:hypothetical protein